MEKLKMHSPNLVAQNIEQLAALFPNCVTESRGKDGELKRAIDFDLLKQELSAHIVDGPQERYQLNWPGKREALLTANAPIAKTLRPCRNESVDFDTTRNLFIEGNNLDAIKLLQETYLDKVKLIYIDPPYNTGKDFIYKDDFSVGAQDFLERSHQADQSGARLVANLESNGRFHSDWLSMIYARLKLSRNLLRDDGYIVVSIDDAEFSNLKRVMDEIFGEQNELAILCWDRNRKNDARFFSVGHEYMLVYAKNRQYLIDNGVILREPREGIDEAEQLYAKLRAKHGDNYEAIQVEWREYYKKIPNTDPKKKIGRFSKVGHKGPFRDDGDISWPGGGGPKYEVIHPETKCPCKIPSGGWCYSKPERFWEEFDAGHVVFGPDETTLPRQCRFLFEGDGQVMPSVFYSYAQTATFDFVELMGGRVFDNPKSWKDIQRIVRYLSKGDDLILDFFAGSATTAHAVMTQNAKDGGNRRFILVQLAEVIPEKTVAYQSGYRTIPDISRERIRRAGKKVLESVCHENWIKDIGFRTLKIDLSNMTDVHYNPDAIIQDDLFAQVDNIKADRTEEDLLFQVMLDWGVDLMAPILRQTIDGKTVFFVDADAQYQHGALVACFDKTGGIDDAFIRQLAAFSPLRLVFRDAGFASDAVKINAEQLLKQLSPLTEVKAI